MRILNRLFAGNRKTSRFDSSASRPARISRRHAIRVEDLEGRNLLSDIPGVTLQYGMLGISATLPSNNQASINFNSSSQTYTVTLNGNSEVFAANSIYSVNYQGSQGGGDTFINNTYLMETAYGYGGNNDFVGGGTYNYVNLYGDFNTFDAKGGYSDVYTYNGPNDDIVSYSDVNVTTQNYNTSWFW